MFRAVVATYLMLTTIAGPWLCCCSTAHVSLLFHPHSPSNQQPEPKPAERSCCAHQGQAKQQECPSPSNSGKPGDGPGCPCQKESTCNPVLLPVDSDFGHQLLDRHFSQGLVDVASLCFSKFCRVAMAHCLAFQNCNPIPILSAHDLLRVMHNLCC